MQFESKLKYVKDILTTGFTVLLVIKVELNKKLNFLETKVYKAVYKKLNKGVLNKIFTGGMGCSLSCGEVLVGPTK